MRVFEWVAPFYCYIATGAHESRLFKAWHPIDDNNCYTFYIHFDLHRPLDVEAIYSNWGHRTSPPEYKTAHSLANMHLQDRELMERGNFSGVIGASIQDRAVQESMGPICDRTQEHLGTSDKAVIFYRRLLLQKLKELADDKPLPAHDPALSFDQRACSSEMPSDRALAGCCQVAGQARAKAGYSGGIACCERAGGWDCARDGGHSRKGSLVAIGRAFNERHLSVREAVDWYLKRIEALNHAGPCLNAVREIAPDALDAARRADDELAAGRRRGLLHGIPVLVKDNILVAGMSATAGAAALKGFKPRYDATLVARLRAAGAIVIGKTNLTEFADYVSDVMPSGFSGAGGMVKNPHGVAPYGRGLGSSVGSAAAVAARLVPVAIGWETQNSIQTPSCVSSVYGFKPSVGMVSRAGMVPLVPSQDSPGPIAASIEDIALVLSLLAGADSADTATLEMPHDLSGPLRPRDPGRSASVCRGERWRTGRISLP